MAYYASRSGKSNKPRLNLDKRKLNLKKGKLPVMPQEK